MVVILASTLVCPTAFAGDETFECAARLGGDPQPLIENLFNQDYADQAGVAGKQAFVLLKNKLNQRILEKCRKGCTDEELAVVTKATLDQFFEISHRVGKYSHILSGWIILTAALVGLSDLSFSLSQHLPGQLSSSISITVNVLAVMLLNPVMSSPASKIFRGFYRVAVYGKSFFRKDQISDVLDTQSSVVRAKQTPIETQQVGRIMQTTSYAASRAKEATDLISSIDQEIGPGRAASNLATIAVMLHKYFPELNPDESNDVSMTVHELFTKWLPQGWSSEEKRLQLFEMIMANVKANDSSVLSPRDENYHRLLIKKWLDLY